MADNVELKRHVFNLYRYALELVKEGYITRENIDDNRKTAHADADCYVKAYSGQRMDDEIKEELHLAEFVHHFAKFVRNVRIKTAQIKLSSPEWYKKVKVSVNPDGTALVIADNKIPIIKEIQNSAASTIDIILQCYYYDPIYNGDLL